MDKRDLYARAAEYLERYGWTQCTAFNRETGAMCISGALASAWLGVHEHNLVLDHTYAPDVELRDAYEGLVAQLHLNGLEGLQRWNDSLHPQRGKNVVIDILRTAAA